MAGNEFVYAVARIRGKESALLTASFLEQLLVSGGEKESLRLLRERGWGEEGQDAGAMLRTERKRAWELIAELMGDRMELLNVLRYENDFHNLKAAIKDACSVRRTAGIYVDGGTLPAELMRSAAENRDFSALPGRMAAAGEEAMELLLKLGDGQLCDCALDRAALELILEAGRESGVKVLQDYAELRCAAGNIKIAARSARTGKDRGFMERSLAECASLNKKQLIDAAAAGIEAIGAYLRHTDYADAADELKKSAFAFERWCDNAVIRSIRPQLLNSFGPGPLAAYILARENEIRTVRIILSGQRNQAPEQALRERVRETYV